MRIGVGLLLLGVTLVILRPFLVPAVWAATIAHMTWGPVFYAEGDRIAFADALRHVFAERPPDSIDRVGGLVRAVVAGVLGTAVVQASVPRSASPSSGCRTRSASGH